MAIEGGSSSLNAECYNPWLLAVCIAAAAAALRVIITAALFDVQPNSTTCPVACPSHPESYCSITHQPEACHLV
jgi:hypothetical protein